MYKSIILTSDSLRHRYFAAEMANHFDVLGVYMQAKRNYYTEQLDQSIAVQAHFEKIMVAEEKWFVMPAGRVLPEFREVYDINAKEVVEEARSLGADCICLFGTAILKPIWLDAFENRIINLHLGLSPYYRGSATLFWPFVFRELKYLGTTIHLATKKVDAGSILQRLQPELIPGEDYYAITNRLIRHSMEQMPRIISRYLQGKIEAKPQENISFGRLFKKADFNEKALKEMLEYAGQGLTQKEINSIIEARCHCSL